jgi:hypothetical protein
MAVPIFRDSFSGRNHGPFERLETPETLGQLRGVVRTAGRQQVHAMGSAWAFSAPAYCRGVIVDTSRLSGFPEHLQPAVRQPADASRLYVWVEAGIKIRNLNLALSGFARLSGGRYGDDRSGPSAALRGGRTLAIASLGGAGGQSLAGAVSTGTHGGDVARPPIGDYVRAMLVVGSGGQLRLMQPEPVVVDVEALRRALPGVDVRDARGRDAFNAAVCSVGRFGVVYAYLMEVRDESSVAVVQHRRPITWRQFRRNIPTTVAAALAQDEFLQVVIDPVRPDDGNRRGWVTRQRDVTLMAGGPVPPTIPGAGNGFGLADIAGLASIPITPEPPSSSGGPNLIGQMFCQERQNAFTELAATALRAFGTGLALAFFPVGALLAVPFYAAADAFLRIGPGYNLGDAVAEVLNLFTTWGAPQLLELVNTALLAMADSQRVMRPDGRPWLVHGRRWQIADFFDYDNDCFGGDSIEIFFRVDGDLADKIEQVFGVFDNLRSRGIAIGAYIALRFLAPTSALLGMAAFRPATCSIEIAMLGRLLGNTGALAQLQAVALRNNGRIHWGQRNDVTGREVRDMYGAALTTWKTQLAALEGGSRTFSNRFTWARDLEPDRPAAWGGWVDTGIVAASSPSVVPATHGRPLEIFVLGTDRTVFGQVRPAAGPAGDWRQLKPEVRAPRATPVAIRADDGRVEIFVRDDLDNLAHCWEEGLGSGRFSSWDIKGGSRIEGDPAAVANADGRLEVFAQEFSENPAAAGGRPMRHCYQRHRGALWSGLEPLAAGPVAMRPAGACLRRGVDSQVLVVVTANEEGLVVWCSQRPGGWTGWNFLGTPPGGVLAATGDGSPIAVAVTGPGMAVHAFVAHDSGRVFEAVEQDVTAAVSWGAWQPLPELPSGEGIDPGSRLTATQTRTLWLFGVSESRTAMAIEFTPGAGWGTWVDLGGNIDGNLACGFLDDGLIEVFARRTGDDRLMARRQLPSGRWR